MTRRAQLVKAAGVLVLCVSGLSLSAAADSGRGLRQLSFSIPSSAVPGLLGLVSPVEPPPPSNATAAPGPQPALAAFPDKEKPAGSDPDPIPEGSDAGLPPTRHLPASPYNTSDATLSTVSSNSSQPGAFEPPAPSPGPNRLGQTLTEAIAAPRSAPAVHPGSDGQSPLAASAASQAAGLGPSQAADRVADSAPQESHAPSPGSPGNHSTLQGSLGSAAGSSDAASTMSPSQGSPGSPPSGIMGLLPKLENNLVQHMQMAQRDNANVHSFNLSLGTMTAPAPAPAPGPGTLSVSGDLGDVTTVQEGPRVKVEVHVDPVVTINGGMTIQTNDSASQTAPVLAAFFPPSPPPPPPQAILSDTSTAAEAPEEICGGGTAPFVACPPSVTTLIPPDTGPGARSLSTRAGAMLGSPEESSANTSAGHSLPQNGSGPVPDALLNAMVSMAAMDHAHLPGALPHPLPANGSGPDPTQVLGALSSAEQAMNTAHNPDGDSALPLGPSQAQSSASGTPDTNDAASPSPEITPHLQYGPLYSQNGWPRAVSSPTNWALILTATSSTITCVAVIFLVLLFLVFRLGGCRERRGVEAQSRLAPSPGTSFKTSTSSLATQEPSPRRRPPAGRAGSGRERRLRVLDFLRRSTSTVKPALAASPPADVEKGACTPTGCVGVPLGAQGRLSSPTSEDALLASRSRLQSNSMQSCVARANAAAVACSGPVPLPSPFASQQEQVTGRKSGKDSSGIAPSPFACENVQGPFSSPPPSAA